MQGRCVAYGWMKGKGQLRSNIDKKDGEQIEIWKICKVVWYRQSLPPVQSVSGRGKVNQAKYPQKSKDQHVPSKRHVQEKKNLIQNKTKRPQRLKIKNEKNLWIPKLLNVAMNLKERFQMTSNFANPKVSLIHKSSKLPFSKSILGPYIPKSIISFIHFGSLYPKIQTFSCISSKISSFPSPFKVCANGNLSTSFIHPFTSLPT